MTMQRTPIFFCFCGPTGCGKTTLTKRLVQSDQSVFLSVSTTTRPPRAGEVDGREYFFVTRDEFLSRVKQGRFIEHAEVSGQLYGTERMNFERCAERGGGSPPRYRLSGCAGTSRRVCRTGLHHLRLSAELYRFRGAAKGTGWKR